jgi:hypothetical protein
MHIAVLVPAGGKEHPDTLVKNSAKKHLPPHSNQRPFQWAVNNFSGSNHK